MDTKTQQQITQAITALHAGYRKIDLRGKTVEAKRYIRAFVMPLMKPMTPGLAICEIPDAVLKAFFDQMVEECGYNSVLIRRSKTWLKLNIYPMGHRHHTDREMAEMEQFFIRLDMAGFINFASAGTIWRIENRG